ncbi:LAQU0S07e02784g1_1 [Lachancea quebecensis]|uniref:LAQU0S07e02784g1_1 n=1 Tax=Lachancea quebecensis TaxID=1654605 RepID=A0A0P1KSV7_9SACH|nr:LAQU0S07e02784g1_1 [Lachancea quebecensis]
MFFVIHALLFFFANLTPVVAIGFLNSVIFESIHSTNMEDAELSLSSEALKALLEFQQEEEEREKKLKILYADAEKKFEDVKAQEGMGVFKEDWQLSQFWYDEATANLLAQALLEGATEDTVIAILSVPSVFAAITKMPPSCVPTKHIYLFEYDKRFEALAGSEHFCFYDYAHPLEFPDSLKGSVHRILIDPPYLNKSCQTKCERMAEIVLDTYKGTRKTTFIPSHANGLSNEFECYANFEWNGWKFKP